MIEYPPQTSRPFIPAGWKCLLVAKLIKSCSRIKHKMTCILSNNAVGETSYKFELSLRGWFIIAIHSARECCRCKLIDCVRLLWLISMTTAERPKMTSGLPKFSFEENGLKSSSVRKRKILAHLKFSWIAWPLSIVKLSKLNQRATWTLKTWQRL